ncbi:response regulator with CheY-like receiver domain and winged-helix DNA-binding domain [Acetobacter sp. CAG:977]|nr:response regulator with CheY-like receiver domain and winged-helix DNA-binding domain [Acetobacter sp. CAG:977]
MRILLIEDDGLIGDGIKNGLEKLGFTVDWFSDGNDGHEALFQAQYDAVVLDLGLPGMDGLSILKDWRNKSRNEPVLILTAKGDVDERIKGLNSGADDYLGKPFALKEVQARLNALIRRKNGVSAPQIAYKNITFDPQSRKTFLNGNEVTLSPKETAVLEALLMNKNKVLSKEALENKIYSWDEDVSSNAVEVHIHHLRKKLGKDIVKTVNKIGYIMEA